MPNSVQQAVNPKSLYTHYTQDIGVWTALCGWRREGKWSNAPELVTCPSCLEKLGITEEEEDDGHRAGS